MKPLHVFFTHKGASYRLVLHDQLGIQSICYDTRSLPQDPDWRALDVNDTVWGPVAWGIIAWVCARLLQQLMQHSTIGTAAGAYTAYTLGEVYAPGVHP